MDLKDKKEHYRRDIEFHLRCAKESAVKLMHSMDPKDVEDMAEMVIIEERILLIDSVIGYGVE